MTETDLPQDLFEDLSDEGHARSLKKLERGAVLFDREKAALATSMESSGEEVDGALLSSFQKEEDNRTEWQEHLETHIASRSQEATTHTTSTRFWHERDSNIEEERDERRKRKKEQERDHAHRSSRKQDTKDQKDEFVLQTLHSIHFGETITHAAEASANAWVAPMSLHDTTHFTHAEPPQKITGLFSSLAAAPVTKDGITVTQEEHDAFMSIDSSQRATTLQATDDISATEEELTALQSIDPSQRKEDDAVGTREEHEGRFSLPIEQRQIQNGYHVSSSEITGQESLKRDEVFTSSIASPDLQSHSSFVADPQAEQPETSQFSPLSSTEPNMSPSPLESDATSSTPDMSG